MPAGRMGYLQNAQYMKRQLRQHQQEVKRQKTFKRQGRVTDEKQARLEELGFVWSKRPAPRRRSTATESPVTTCQ